MRPLNPSRLMRAFLAAAFFGMAGDGFLRADPPPLPPFPPLSFEPPKPARHTLGNGLVVLLLEDHELPLIRLETYFPAGSQLDPPDQVGLSALLADGMTSGGGASHTPETIERLLERKAASISFAIGLENGSGTMSSRAEDFDAVFAVFVDLFLRPQFRKDKLELAKGKTRELLRRRNDDPEEMARREFRAILYGSTHPYARSASPASIDRVKRDDLLAMHARCVIPNGSFLAVSGDFQSAAMLEKIKRAFTGWPRREPPAPVVTDPTPPEDRRVYYIQRSINQTQIRIGDIGLARHNPDHFAWEVFNELWGGGAASRLFRVVRTQKGLAYAVGSAYSEFAKPGLIVAICQTRGSQTMAAIQSIMDVTRDVKNSSFTAQDIQWAKDAIINRFIENFTSSAQIASYRMGLDYFGFPADYLDTYTARIAAVSADDLRRAAGTYLRPDKSAILVVGDLSTFDKPLSTLGRVQEIKPLDYSEDR